MAPAEKRVAERYTNRSAAHWFPGGQADATRLENSTIQPIPADRRSGVAR
jgi:hypothetical protein